MSYAIEEGGQTTMLDKDGERIMLANFNAKVTKETKYTDGKSAETVLTIQGSREGVKLPEIEIQAKDFQSLAWVMTSWGSQAVISPGQTVKDHLRTAIQMASKPKYEEVATHTGWALRDKKWIYLHAGGAVTEKGNSDRFRVELPIEMQAYRLSTTQDQKRSAENTLSILEIAHPKITYPMLAAIFAPILGEVDFAFHFTGRTGTYKSELASIVQSHYGAKFDARHLPGSWSSTPNALEAQAYKAKDAVFVIDDFIPAGTSWQVRAYQKTADQLIRGQGNQAGRARLTDISRLQSTMYPRGMIFSTGEDTPEGQSVRGRMIIVEISPGDVTTAALTKAQALREVYAASTGNFIAHMIPRKLEQTQTHRALAKEIRDSYVEIGHSRTPSSIGIALSAINQFLLWCTKVKAIDEKGAKQRFLEAEKAFVEIGESQTKYLQAADPCEAFCEAIRHLLASHIAHIRTRDGGIPAGAESFGWVKEESRGDLPVYRSHGKCLGWLDWDQDELYVDVAASYGDIRKHSGGVITLTKLTMLKRLKDAGLLTKVDDTRQRNTIRLQCENQTRTVVAMPISKVLEINERPHHG